MLRHTLTPHRLPYRLPQGLPPGLPPWFAIYPYPLNIQPFITPTDMRCSLLREVSYPLVDCLLDPGFCCKHVGVVMPVFSQLQAVPQARFSP